MAFVDAIWRLSAPGSLQKVRLFNGGLCGILDFGTRTPLRTQGSRRRAENRLAPDEPANQSIQSLLASDDPLVANIKQEFRPMSFRICVVGSLLGATLSLPAVGATSIGDHLTLSGFGTVGGVATDDDSAQYVRPTQIRGGGTGGSLMVDSNLGLQLDAKATSWLSATVQTLTEQRMDPHLSTKIEWAFVKIDPTDDLSFHLGRFPLSTFLISDSRAVGYANTWLRPADEVYGLAMVSNPTNGGEASYRFKFSGQQITLTGLAGAETQDVQKVGSTRIRDIRGLNLVWDGDWFTFRVGRLTAEPQLPAWIWALASSSGKERYTFDGVGLSVDRSNVVLQAEYVRRRSAHFDQLIGADGWYVLGGYRLGSWLPYVEHADTKPDHGSAAIPQTTNAVGVRWDAFSSAAIKFQAARVDTHGTTGISFITPVESVSAAGIVYEPITHPVTTLSVAIDFVF